MKISIEGNAEEITALVLDLQRRQESQMRDRERVMKFNMEDAFSNGAIKRLFEKRGWPYPSNSSCESNQPSNIGDELETLLRESDPLTT